MSNQDHDMMMKMVFVGDSGVGKTNLLTRVTTNVFEQRHLATIGVEFKNKCYQIDGLKVKVQFWDTAGQERYRSISAPYYRGADTIILCYNLNDMASLDSLEKWFEEVMRYAGQNTKTVLIGCKSDLENMVPADIVNQMIGERGFKHYVTSAKTGEGVEEAFQAVVTDWTRNIIKQNLGLIMEKRQAEKNEKVNAVKEPKAKGPKTGCC